jgi:hypothetical protein
MSQINSRFRDFIERTGYTPSKFAAEIGVNHESVNRVVRDPELIPSINMLVAAKRRFPILNLNYLITGEEKLFVSDYSPRELINCQEEVKRLQAALDKRDETIASLTSILKTMQDQLNKNG